MKKKIIIITLLLLGLCFNVNATEYEYREFPDLKSYGFSSFWFKNEKTIVTTVDDYYECENEETGGYCNAYSISLNGEASKLNDKLGSYALGFKYQIEIKDKQVYMCDETDFDFEEPTYPVDEAIANGACKKMDGVLADDFYYTSVYDEDKEVAIYIVEYEGKFAIINNKEKILDYSSDYEIVKANEFNQAFGLYNTKKDSYLIPSLTGNYEEISSDFFISLKKKGENDTVFPETFETVTTDANGNNIYLIYSSGLDKYVFATKDGLLSENFYFDGNAIFGIVDNYEFYKFNNEILFRKSFHEGDEEIEHNQLYKINGERYIDGDYNVMAISDKYIVLYDIKTNVLSVRDASGEVFQQKLELDKNTQMRNIVFSGDTILINYNYTGEDTKYGYAYYPAIIAPKHILGEYSFLDNTANQTYTKSTDDTLKLRVDGKLEYFVNVYIDDQKVAPENYTVKSGSTIIEFTKAFMQSLSEGKHTIKVEFTDNVISTDVIIAASASSVPDTFDGIMLAVIGLSISAIGVGILINRKRRLS